MSTLSFKGDTSNEINLAITIFLLEGIPQLLILALSMIHWHGPFETVVIDLFCTTVNVPLRKGSNKQKINLTLPELETVKSSKTALKL